MWASFSLQIHQAMQFAEMQSRAHRRRDRPHYLNWQTEIQHALKTALENTMAKHVVMYSYLRRTTSYPVKPKNCDMFYDFALHLVRLGEENS